MLCSDAAQGMVDLIAATVAHLPQVSAARIDAAEIPLPDGSVDAVAFQMGLMFALDPVTACSEIRRVLAPGGRVGIAVWAGPEHNPWLSCLGMAAMAQGVVTGGPPTGPGGLFSLSDPEVLRSTVARGGFEHVEIEQVAVEIRFDGLEDHFDHVSRLAGPLAAALAAAPEKLDAVRATTAQLASAYLTEDGLVMPGRAYLASARG